MLKANPHLLIMRLPMKTYQGGCHCGAVSFQVSTDFADLIECNCSICTKKGTLNLRTPADQFTLLTGEDHLQLYQFNTQVAQHYFCKTCGIHPFSRPRSAPDKYSVNLRCLANINPNDYPTQKFDGQNWEQTVALIKQQKQ